MDDVEQSRDAGRIYQHIVRARTKRRKKRIQIGHSIGIVQQCRRVEAEQFRPDRRVPRMIG